MSEGVMVIGLRGTIQYVNPAALDILEKSEEQLASKKIGEIFITICSACNKETGHIRIEPRVKNR